MNLKSVLYCSFQVHEAIRSTPGYIRYPGLRMHHDLILHVFNYLNRNSELCSVNPTQNLRILDVPRLSAHNISKI